MERERETTLKFRSSEEKDADALAQLINRAFEVERPIFDGDRIDRDGVTGYLQKGQFLIAEDATGMVGCVYAQVRGDTGYIGLLSVEPARQGTGLGRKLMEAAENFFRQMGCTQVELRVVSARAPLPGFYRHLGYSESRIEPLPANVPAKVPCHFQYMVKTFAK
jgi:GNAT superfamily N-acetyltransferase